MFRTALILLSVLALAGCAPTESSGSLTQADIARFTVPADRAKAFFFLYYGGNIFTKDIGTFASLAVGIDGEPVGEAGSGEYIEVDLAPGRHQIDLDKDGLLVALHPPPITVTMLAGRSSFFAMQIDPSGKRAMVSKVGPEFGMKSVMGRTRHGDAVAFNGPALAPPTMHLTAAPDAAAALSASAQPAAATPAAATPAAIPAAATTPDPLESLQFAKGEPRPDDVAVIIGNSVYGGRDVPAVPPARNDAAMMRRYAVEALGVSEANVIMLDNATAAQLVEVFGNDRDPKGKLYDWVRPGRSRVFVYYAGHGAPSGPGGTPMLVPVDASAAQIGLSGYPLDTLYANLAKLPAVSVTVVLEACFSGGSAAGSLVPAASPVSIAVKPTAVPARLTVITAGTAGQIASWEPDGSHGLFTEYFLKGMAGAADKAPTGNGDGTVSLDELARYLQENVAYLARRDYGRDQTVQVVRGQGP